MNAIDGQQRSSHPSLHHRMAIVCFGLFAGAMALNALPFAEKAIEPTRGMLWNAFHYGLPLLIGGICLTGQRVAFMVAVIYGTIGLALDIATLAQHRPADSMMFIIIMLTTGFLNVFLIILGGTGLLPTTAPSIRSQPSID